MKRVGPVLALVLFAAAPAGARTETAGAVWHAPVPDVAELRADEAERAAWGESGPHRVGHPLDARLTPQSSGRWRVEPDGDHVWSIELRAPGALWTVVGFDRFRLPRAATVVVRQTSGPRAHGPYDVTHAIDGELWVPPIEGPSTTVELNWPARLGQPEPALRIGTVSYGYRPWNGYGAAAASPPIARVDTCDIDVNCPLGDDWQDEKRGVVRLLIAGSVGCTGSLVNTTSLDCAPLVLTGDHCYDPIDGFPPLTPAATVYAFGFERPACGGAGEPGAATVAGSTLVARYDPTDFRIHLLPSLPAGVDLYFNGWDRSGAVPQEAWAIHHPLGDFKKIASDPEPVSQDGVDFWRVNQWEHGSLANGSSGCPLLDSNGLIVGQLFAGTTVCDDPLELANFGKLSRSWNQGLSDVLDPTGTGVASLPGMDGEFCGNPRPRLAFTASFVDDAQGNADDGNADGIADPSEVLRLEVELSNDGPLPATQVVAALISDGSDVTVVDALADYGTVPANGSSISGEPHFTIDIDPGVECGALLPFTMGIESSQGAWVSGFALQTGVRTGFQQPPMFFDDVESGANGWSAVDLVGSNSWTQVTTDSQSPSHSWFVANVTGVRDSTLIMPGISPVPFGAVLRFFHRIDSELGSDGGVLEYTTDGGTWFDARDLIVAGGYDGGIASSFQSPLAGRDAWTGDNGGFQSVEVDLSPFEGGVVVFRWRFATDQFGGDQGWWIDDVSVERGQFQCSFRVLPGALCRGDRADAPAGGYECGTSRPRRPAAHDRQR